jgi:hypothetical protein
MTWRDGRAERRAVVGRAAILGVDGPVVRVKDRASDRPIGIERLHEVVLRAIRLADAVEGRAGGVRQGDMGQKGQGQEEPNNGNKSYHGGTASFGQGTQKSSDGDTPSPAIASVDY